jgi:ABC-type sulfate transport system substrate-binding protein
VSEHTLVEIERNIDPDERELIRAFVEYLWSETAQRIFVEDGFRSVDERLNTENPAFGRIESVSDQRLRRLDRRQARDY